jgi:acyl-coenzyme A thioesterase PaaI-like protein
VSDPNDANPPPGFLLSEDRGGPFIAHNGPVFYRDDADGLVLGFRAMPHHSNSVMTHGGWLASFMDMLLPLAAGRQAGISDHSMLTVSMSLDYLAAVPIGAWVEGRGESLRRTKRLIFCSAVATIEGEPVLRGSGVWRIGQRLRDFAY